MYIPITKRFVWIFPKKFPPTEPALSRSHLSNASGVRLATTPYYTTPMQISILGTAAWAFGAANRLFLKNSRLNKSDNGAFRRPVQLIYYSSRSGYTSFCTASKQNGPLQRRDHENSQ
jgi:hypothetical protein